MANQKIKCGVESCQFQDEKKSCCTLDEIKVGCDCGCKEAENSDSTVCKSFKCDCNKLEKEEN